MNNLNQDRKFSWNNTNSTHLFVVFMGTIAGLVGIVHGIYETLQGNTPTGGFMLATIGAFSIIPNYLLTGIATIIVGLSLSLWTIGYIHKKNGPAVFLILAVLLFLVGGGVAQVAFTPIIWAVSTRINKPLAWWKKAIPENPRRLLARAWPAIFIIGSSLLSIGIGIWLILLPPVATYKAPILQYTCWTFVSLGFVFQILTIISGFARDVERQKAFVIAH